MQHGFHGCCWSHSAWIVDTWSDGDPFCSWQSWRSYIWYHPSLEALITQEWRKKHLSVFFVVVGRRVADIIKSQWLNIYNHKQLNPHSKWSSQVARLSLYKAYILIHIVSSSCSSGRQIKLMQHSFLSMLNGASFYF